MECVQNSLEAGSDKITLDILQDDKTFRVSIADNGCGMDQSDLKRIRDPYFTDGQKHRKRRVGLGIPFLHQILEQTGGYLEIQSEPGKGTTVIFQFDLMHIDTPPAGDLAGVLLQTITFDGAYELVIQRRIIADDGGTVSYSVSRTELQNILGDLNTAESLVLAKQFLLSQEETE